MLVKKINLNNDGLPEKVTVKLSVQEIAFISKILGKMNGIQSAEVMRDGDSICTELYSGFTGDVFNRYWDDGINEYPGDS